MSKNDFKKLLDNLNIEYSEEEYHFGQSGIQLENAASYLQLKSGEYCSLYYAAICIYFDNNDNFILIEGTE